MLSTFLTQTSQALQPDYSQITASLLTELVLIQRISAIGGNVSAISNSTFTYGSKFSPSRNDLWVNGLWFTSLALSLSTALMAGLIKQWLQYYVADISGSRRTPRDKACLRHFRFIGLTKWRVRFIVELLPILMNVALLLFFIGLIMFLRILNGPMAWWIVALTSTAYLTYIVTSFVPLIDPQCPYKTSLTWTLHALKELLFTVSFWIRRQSRMM